MDTAKNILVAMLICFGLLFLIFKQLPDSAIRKPWEPTPADQNELARQETPQTTAKAPHQPMTQEPRSDRGHSTAKDVAQLRADCVKEVKRGGSASWRAKGACAEYERAVAGVGDPTVNLSKAPGILPEQRRDTQRSPGDGRVSPTVFATECTGHGYGTVAYRKCRADEKARLLRICKADTDRAEKSTGSTRQQQKQIALANCRVADLYQIVK